MLHVTSTAATALAEARIEKGLPEHFGIRISAVNSNGQTAYQLGFVERPLAGDGITETDGTRVFIAADVAEPLDGAVLDVAETGRLTLTQGPS